MLTEALDNRRPTRDVVVGLQYLRGIAAAMVVLAHVNSMMRYPYLYGASPLALPDLGTFGVAIFFIISGFIIATTTLNEDLRPTISLRGYALRRFLRIVPYLWLCVIAYNVISFAGTRVFEPWAFAGALVAWPVGDLKPNVIWSLRHEFLFYALFGLTLLAARSRWWLLATWCAAPLVVHAMLDIAPPDHILEEPYVVQLLWTVLGGAYTGANLQFGCGLAIAVLWLRAGYRPESRHIGPVIVLAMSASAAALFIAIPHKTALGFTAFALPPFLIALIAGPGSGWLHRAGMLLGNASFSIYLVHNLTIMIAIRGIGRMAGVPPWAYLLILTVLAIAVGVIAYLCVERPLVRWLTRRRGRGVPVAALPTSGSTA